MRKLREGERISSEGTDLVEVMRRLEVPESTRNRWRHRYGGMDVSQAKRLKELEMATSRTVSADPSVRADTPNATSRRRLFGIFGLKRLPFMVSTVVLLLTLFSAAPSAGDVPGSDADVPDPDPVEDARVESSDEALEADASFLSDRLDVPREGTRQQLAYQQAVGTMIGDLPEDVMETAYAGGRFDPHSPDTVTLFFKGEVPAEVREAVSAAGVPGVELQGGMRFSLEELRRRSQAVHAALADLGFREFSTGIEIATQRIKIEAVDFPGAPASGGLASTLVSLLTDPNRQDPLQITPDELVIVIHPEGTTLTKPEG